MTGYRTLFFVVVVLSVVGASEPPSKAPTTGGNNYATPAPATPAPGSDDEDERILEEGSDEGSDEGSEEATPAPATPAPATPAPGSDDEDERILEEGSDDDEEGSDEGSDEGNDETPAPTPPPGSGSGETPAPTRAPTRRCSDGKFFADSSTCTVCPSGKYSEDSDNPCITCGAGRSVTDTGSTEDMACIACVKGRYSSSTDVACIRCVIGTYSTTVGGSSTSDSVCISCESGKYSPSAGATDSCSDCTAGSVTLTQEFVVVTQAASLCTKCTKGQWSNSPTIQCITCGAGKYTVSASEGFTAETDCILCPSGYFLLTPANPAGDCTFCNAGSVTDMLQGKGSSTCTQCPLGKSSNQSIVACAVCPVASYANASGTSECIACPAGTFLNSTGAKTPTDCADCNVTFFAQSPMSIVCTLCTPGSVTDTLTSERGTSCTACLAGTYSTTSSTACKPCNKGKYSDKDEASFENDCKLCSAGRYNSDTGSNSESACVLCVPGAATDTLNSAGATMCTECRAGFWQNDPTRACIPCVAGRFNEDTGAERNNCLKCDVGRYSVLEGMSSNNCTVCTPGRYNVKEGSGIEELCLKCDLGQYQPSNGSESCNDCDPGRAMPRTGSSEENCDICSVGKYAPDIETTECISCSAGRFQNVEGQTSCRGCDAGMYQDEVDKTACKACDIGKYSATLGLATSAGCLACGEEKDALTTEHEGAKASSDCKCRANYYWNDTAFLNVSNSSELVRTRGLGSLSCNSCDGLDGAVCEEVDLQLSAVPAKVGYWRGEPYSNKWTKCDKARVILTEAAVDVGERQKKTKKQKTASSSGTEQETASLGTYTWWEHGTNNVTHAESAAAYHTDTFASWANVVEYNHTYLPYDSTPGSHYDCRGGRIEEQCSPGTRFDESTVLCYRCAQAYYRGSSSQCIPCSLDDEIMVDPSVFFLVTGVCFSLFFVWCVAAYMRSDDHFLYKDEDEDEEDKQTPSALALDTSKKGKKERRALERAMGFNTLFGAVAAQQLLRQGSRARENLAQAQLEQELEEATNAEMEAAANDMSGQNVEISGADDQAQAAQIATSGIPTHYLSSIRAEVGSRSNVLRHKLDNERKHITGLISKFGADKRQALMSRAKIIIGWAQMLGSCQWTFSAVPWPKAFVQQLEGLYSVFAIDIFALLSATNLTRGWECQLTDESTDFLTLWSVHMLTLPYAALLVALAYGIAVISIKGDFVVVGPHVCVYRAFKCKKKKKKKKAEQNEPPEMRGGTAKGASVRAIKILLGFIFLLYPSFCSKIFRLYKCRSVGDKRVLDADLSINCDSDRYRMYAYVIGPVVGPAYVLGLPLLILAVLIKHRHEIRSNPDQPLLQYQYGQLFRMYEPKYYYFEIVEMARKMLLTGGLIMINQETDAGSLIQVALGQMVCLIYLVIFFNTMPLLDDADDTLQQAVSLQLLMTLMIAILLKGTSALAPLAIDTTMGQDEDIQNKMMQTLLMAMLVCSYVAGAFCFVLAFGSVQEFFASLGGTVCVIFSPVLAFLAKKRKKKKKLGTEAKQEAGSSDSRVVNVSANPTSLLVTANAGDSCTQDATGKDKPDTKAKKNAVVPINAEK